MVTIEIRLDNLELLLRRCLDEIQVIPRLVDTWLRAGWMEPDEAVEWKLGALAWAEFHRISPETDPS